MFFAVAWLRPLLVLSVFTVLVAARDEQLYTSSVSYCQPPETLLVQQFDIAYFPKNHSVVFNISAASVESNVNVTANLFLNVYGAHPFNTTIDLCHILNGALCPLPKYNFVGADSIRLPSSLSVTNQIPGIAYKIPDLEAYAQLTLIEVGTGKIKACVQSTLSNGWSTRQPAVEWSTGGLALGTLLLSLWQSLSPTSLLPFRLLDLIYLYQSIAVSGLLKLNYPSVYRSFTLNFAWALGLFSSANSGIQHAIDTMRHHTGGKMADSSSGSGIGLVNRKLSPYNNDDSATMIRTFMAKIHDLGSKPAPSASVDQFQVLATAGEVVTATPGSTSVLDAGVPIYANSLHIATANAFMTVFFITLIIAAIAIGFFGLGYLVLLACREKKWAREMKETYPLFVRSWVLRITLVLLTPGLIFTFYQWTLHDSWVSVLLSVVFLITVPGYVVYTTFLTVRLATRSTPESLYSHTEFVACNGPLYRQYRVPRYYFFLPLLAASLLKALIVAFAKAHGLTQAILIVLVELFLIVTTLILRPHETRGADVLSTFLAVVRLIAAGLSIAFAEQLALKAIPRVVIGIIVVVLFSIAVVVMFCNLLLSVGLGRLRRVGGMRPLLGKMRSRSSADENMLEKGEATTSSAGGVGSSSDESLPRLEGGGESVRGRPLNPTPDKNVLLDPSVNKPYPDVTPAPTIPPTPTSAGTLATPSTLMSVSSVAPHSPASPAYSFGTNGAGGGGAFGASACSGDAYQYGFGCGSMIGSVDGMTPVSFSELPPTPSSFGSDGSAGESVGGDADRDADGVSGGTGGSSVTMTSEVVGVIHGHSGR